MNKPTCTIHAWLFGQSHSHSLSLSPSSSFVSGQKLYFGRGKKKEKVNRWKVRARHDHKWLLHLSNWAKKAKKKMHENAIALAMCLSLHWHINNASLVFSRCVSNFIFIFDYLWLLHVCAKSVSTAKREWKTRYMGFIENFMTIALCVPVSAVRDVCILCLNIWRAKMQTQISERKIVCIGTRQVI